MRLFFALLFDERTKDALSGFQKELRNAASSGNFTSRDNLHITLAFLGEIDPGRLESLRKSLASLPTEPFGLRLSGIGSFGKEGSSQLYWMGIDPEPILFRLADDLRKTLQDGGFPVDDRPFVGHLTLGREVKINHDYDLLEKFRTFSAIPFVPSRISLMESCRIEGKVVYREIGKKTI